MSDLEMKGPLDLAIEEVREKNETYQAMADHCLGDKPRMSSRAASLDAALKSLDAVKTCSCGKTFKTIPAGARYFDSGDELEGWYFECTCHPTTTLFVPAKEVA